MQCGLSVAWQQTQLACSQSVNGHQQQRGKRQTEIKERPKKDTGWQKLKWEYQMETGCFYFVYLFWTVQRLNFIIHLGPINQASGGTSTKQGSWFWPLLCTASELNDPVDLQQLKSNIEHRSDVHSHVVLSDREPSFFYRASSIFSVSSWR